MRAAERRALALSIARRDGCVFAGRNVEKGAVVRFTRRDLELLNAEAVVALRISPDGKLMAIATPEAE